jgi:hypothetical protein
MAIGQLTASFLDAMISSSGGRPAIIGGIMIEFVCPSAKHSRYFIARNFHYNGLDPTNKMNATRASSRAKYTQGCYQLNL